jgi:aminopeptidase-like protein
MVDWDSELSRIDSRFDELWSILRSITGPGFRQSIEVLQKDVPLSLRSVPSGTDVFDWEIPPEWRIRDARLTGPDGEVYADFNELNLAVVSYSAPVDEILTLEELRPHLYTDPDNPDATPYVTSYYERNWGFCLPYETYESLPEGEYHAYIDSEFRQGELTYGHTTLQGESDREILLSTYLCHPMLANNELSGPLVLTSLYKRLSNWDRRKFTYRFVVVPETIGSLTYLWEHGCDLRNNLVGGLVLTCLGGPADHLSYKRTRRENSLLDQVVAHMAEYSDQEFRFRRYDQRGSDERQYNAPGFDLPVGQFARTVYGEYPAYHNSNDTKEFMTIESLVESAASIERVLHNIEYGGYYRNLEPYGEPMMSKRALYPTVNSPERRATENNTDEETTTAYERGGEEFVQDMMRVLSYSDGDHPVVWIANRYGIPVERLSVAIEQLCAASLLEPIEYTPEYSDEFDWPPGERS